MDSIGHSPHTAYFLKVIAARVYVMADFSEPFPTAYPCHCLFSAVYLRVQFFRHLFCVFD